MRALTIAVVAGCHAEFVNFIRQRSREVGHDVSDEYFYVGTPEQACGRHFVGIKRVGRYLWRRDHIDILNAIERNLVPREK